MNTQRTYSGLQKQVLALYRSVLRAAARTKDEETRRSVQQYARQSIEEHRHLGLSQVQLIEHLMRKGAKQLAHLQDPGFSGFKWSK